MKKTIVITGASGSMGASATEALASEGWRVIMACRNLQKGESIRRKVLSAHPGAEVELRLLDLASLDSVKAFVKSLSGEHINVLFNNAGTICRNYERTPDAWEKTFQVNFIGPALLTLLLEKQIDKVVSMVSLTCSLVRIPEGYKGDTEEGFSQLGTYARAKLAMLLFTLEFGSRSGATASLSDPGIVNSNMISMGRWFDPLADVLFRPFWASPEKGVSPALNAIRSDGTEPQYYAGRRVSRIPERFSLDETSGDLFNLISSLR